MKDKLILMFLIFFGNFSFSQITSNTIDVKIEYKYYQNQTPPINTYELKFDNHGRLLKRIGYKILMLSNSTPKDLIETYVYSDEGFTKMILEQEKDINNKITPRFHSKQYYNEKKQLIEMINFNYIHDSIQQKITFEYDANNNRTRINNSDSEYIINQYNSSNKYIKSQLFKNNSYVKDLQIDNDSTFLYRNLPNLKNYRNMSREVYLPQYSYDPETNIRNKVDFKYYKNGIIKTKKTTTSYNNSYYIYYIYSVKCDCKTKYDKSIIEKINKEILQIDIWQ